MTELAILDFDNFCYKSAEATLFGRHRGAGW